MYQFVQELDRSPFFRVPLSEYLQKSGLLSGAQRVPVKHLQPHLTDASAAQMKLRGESNFMKQTESSRVSSTPVRSTAKSPARGRPNSYAPVTPTAADSANINHFVSPTGVMVHQKGYAHSNPLMTPTRSQVLFDVDGSGCVALNLTGTITTQSAGRTQIVNAASASPPAPHIVTPNTVESTRPAVLSGTRKPALVSPAGRVPVSPAITKVVEPSPKRSVSTGRAGGSVPSYLQPTASSQMLFSPDAAARVHQQHQLQLQHQQAQQMHHAVPSSPAEPRTTHATIAMQAPSATRPASAPKTRPQSLSAQMQAHSEQLMAAVMGASPQAAKGSVATAGVTSPSAPAAPRQAEHTAARSPQQVPSSTVPKLSSPTQHNSAPGVAPAGHTKTKPSGIAPPRAVRSADALSANKAAKLAALAAAASHSAAHPVPPTATAATRAARYAQPTHSSAAATAAILANPAAAIKSKVPPPRHTAVAHRPGAGGGAGIAARTMQTTMGVERAQTPASTPTSTPQRATQLTKRPPTAPAAASSLKKRDSDKVPERPARAVVTERGKHTIERKAEQPGTTALTSAGAGAASRSKIPVKTGKPAPTLKHVAQRNGEPAGDAMHGDSIMQILEGHDDPFRQAPAPAEVARKLRRVSHF
jgi:Tfp pilus assembly protein PilV